MSLKLVTHTAIIQNCFINNLEIFRERIFYGKDKKKGHW